MQKVQIPHQISYLFSVRTQWEGGIKRPKNCFQDKTLLVTELTHLSSQQSHPVNQHFAATLPPMMNRFSSFPLKWETDKNHGQQFLQLISTFLAPYLTAMDVGSLALAWPWPRLWRPIMTQITARVKVFICSFLNSDSLLEPILAHVLSNSMWPWIWHYEIIASAKIQNWNL